MTEGEGWMDHLCSHSRFGCRSFLRSMAHAGALAAAAPLIAMESPQAYASNWRGVVGDIKPNARPNDSSLVELIRLLPDGVGVVPVYLSIAEGTREELQGSYGEYEKNVAWLAKQHCDV